MIVGIVNSLQRCELLKVALPSLAQALLGSKLSAAIVVFDAGSTDGSREFVDAYAVEHPELPVHQIKCQPGEADTFSDGINTACAYALEHYENVQWLVLFETDNWAEGPAFLLDAVCLMEQRPRTGAVGFTVRKHEGAAPGFGASFPTLIQFIAGPQFCSRLGLGKLRIQWKHAEKIQYTLCDIVYTSPIVIRRAAWEESGGLDAKAFPFSECDLDWAWCLAELGWEQSVIRTSQVVHDNRAQLSGWSQTRALRFHQARWRLLKRWRGTSVLWLPLLWIRHSIEWLFLRMACFAGRSTMKKVHARKKLLVSSLRGYAD